VKLNSKLYQQTLTYLIRFMGETVKLDRDFFDCRFVLWGMTQDFFIELLALVLNQYFFGMAEYL